MIEISTEFELPKAIERLVQMDLSQPMQRIAKQLHTSILQNFNQQRSPSGAAWLPSQRALRENSKTLIDTGRMLASLTFVSGEDFAKIGYPASIPYAWSLQVGEPEKHVVSREHLGIRDEDEAQILHILHDYFEHLLSD